MPGVAKLFSSIAGRPGQRWTQRQQSRKLKKLVGMTTRIEREFLENYARQTYSGAGEIVDLGSWLGSLTISLLEGLKKNPAAFTAASVHAYDLFAWEDWM